MFGDHAAPSAHDSGLRAPFPYFGGKRRVAAEVWSRFGDTYSYVEPFFGSGAVLLARPSSHRRKLETVNDADGLLCNFWRALQQSPDEVARHADWPVSECDQVARHSWLVERRDGMAARLMSDPEWHDAKAAGWWVWAMASMAIARGRFTESGSPSVAHVGRPQGIIALRDGRIASTVAALSARLRDVRIRCGDWQRAVQSESAIGPDMRTAAVFLDPPYAASTGRDMTCYSVDSGTVAADVTAWAIEHGSNPRLRIAVCGYDEHAALGAHGWTAHEWAAAGGLGSKSDGAGRANKLREVVWFSPHCLGAAQPSLL
jgi:DNA adenine methylase